MLSRILLVFRISRLVSFFESSDHLCDVSLAPVNNTRTQLLSCLDDSNVEDIVRNCRMRMACRIHHIRRISKQLLQLKCPVIELGLLESPCHHNEIFTGDAVGVSCVLCAPESFECCLDIVNI